MARQQQTADDDLISTFGRLVEVHGVLGQQLGRSLEEQVGIRHAWFEVLLRIHRAEGGRISMGALAHQVVLTTGGITRQLDAMIAAGLVRRVPCATDRRVSFAELTDDGQATLAEASSVHAANLRRAFAGFTADDLRELDDLLDRLRAARLD